jgi:ribose transport system permease protein
MKKRNLNFGNLGLFVILIVMIAIFWIIYNPFVSTVNVINILLTVSLIGIIAVPWSMLCIGGGLDISVGSVMGFCAVVTTQLFSNGVNLYLAVILGLAIAGAVGLINGLLITKAGINPLITTLGMLSIIRGLAYIVAGGTGIPIADGRFEFLGLGRIGKLPVSVVILIALFILGYFVLGYTQFGRNVYYIGGNEKAAKTAGINVDFTRISLYVLTSMGAGLAGLINAAQLGTTQPKIGTGYEFAVVTAIVLGGISLAGGKGRILGALLGVLIIGTLKYGLEIIGVHSFYQVIAQGSILLVAVAFDQIKIKHASEGFS